MIVVIYRTDSGHIGGFQGCPLPEFGEPRSGPDCQPVQTGRPWTRTSVQTGTPPVPGEGNTTRWLPGP